MKITQKNLMEQNMEENSSCLIQFSHAEKLQKTLHAFLHVFHSSSFAM